MTTQEAIQILAKVSELDSLILSKKDHISIEQAIKIISQLNLDYEKLKKENETTNFKDLEVSKEK